MVLFEQPALLRSSGGLTAVTEPRAAEEKRNSLPALLGCALDAPLDRAALAAPTTPSARSEWTGISRVRWYLSAPCARSRGRFRGECGARIQKYADAAPAFERRRDAAKA